MLSRRHYSISHVNYAQGNKTPQKQAAKNQKRQAAQSVSKKCEQGNKVNDHHYEQFKETHTQQSSQGLDRSPLATVNFNAPFVSVYGRQTRLEHIMKLKVKPALKSQNEEPIFINLQQKSQANVKKQGKSRLQKIMALKVAKPKITSTLINYQPRVAPRQNPQEKQQSQAQSQETLTECQRSYQRMLQQQEKQHRQWEDEERMRQAELKRKAEQKQKQYQNQRRKQTLFQNMVAKQIKKIERQRELAQRKNGGFAIYVYTCY